MARKSPQRTDAKSTRRRRHNWHALRSEFVRGAEGLREFARRKAIALRVVGRHSSSEGWIAEQTAHRVKVAVRVEERSIERKALAESEIDALAHAIALKLLAKINDAADGALDPADLRALAVANRDTYEQARISARLTPAPLPQAAGPAGVQIIVRTRDEFGAVHVEPAVSEAGTGSAGLPADPDAGAVPPVPLP